jgi:hypothetical protein
MIFILVLSMLFIIIALAMLPMALKNRTAECPPLFPPRASILKPIWRQRRWFTPKGYKLGVISAAIGGIGALLGVIYWLNRWI